MGVSEEELEELQKRPGVKAVKDSREGCQTSVGGSPGKQKSSTDKPRPQQPNPNTIRITLDVEPKGQMRPRFFSAGKFQKTYKHERQKAEESKLLGLLYEYKPQQPLEGAIELSIKAFMPIPKSWPKWKRKAAQSGAVRPDKKPDFDNVAKMICDVFNGVFWKDDAQIVGAFVQKVYSDSPRWEIEIRPLKEG